METQKPQENWPIEKDFNEKHEILKWRDLPKRVYKIQEYEKKTNRFGDTLILTIKTKDSEESIVVWAPQRLTNEL